MPFASMRETIAGVATPPWDEPFGISCGWRAKLKRSVSGLATIQAGSKTCTAFRSRLAAAALPQS
jgi:hypothetical protein